MPESTRLDDISTETALRTDRRLTESQKRALLALHRSYLAAKRSWDSEQYEQYGGLTDCRDAEMWVR
jgi:hypothetical protein